MYREGTLYRDQVCQKEDEAGADHIDMMSRRESWVCEGEVTGWTKSRESRQLSDNMQTWFRYLCLNYIRMSDSGHRNNNKDNNKDNDDKGNTDRNGYKNINKQKWQQWQSHQ